MFATRMLTLGVNNMTGLFPAAAMRHKRCFGFPNCLMEHGHYYVCSGIARYDAHAQRLTYILTDIPAADLVYYITVMFNANKQTEWFEKRLLCSTQRE